jgi:hypothetical protein
MEPIHFNIENFDRNILAIYSGIFKSLWNKIIKLGNFKFQRAEQPEFEKLKLEE